MAPAECAISENLLMPSAWQMSMRSSGGSAESCNAGDILPGQLNGVPLGSTWLLADVGPGWRDELEVERRRARRRRR